MSLQAAWKGWQAIQGDRSMPMLKKAFGVYEHTEDPAFERDMQAFQQNPTRGNADRIINKWGDYLEADNYKELGQRLNYLEGTPQDIQHQINKNQLTQSNIRTEALPELTDAELRIKQGQADITQSNANYQSRFNEQKYNYNDIRNDLQRLDLAFQKQTQPASIEAEIAKANAQAAQGNYQSDYYGNLDPNQMAEYKMTQAGEQARQAEQQTAMNEEKLYQLEQQNSVLNQQLQNDLTIQEQNILSNKINNQINQLQLKKGRKLLPYEIEQAKNQVLTQEAQLRGINLQNQGRVYDNQVAADEAYISGRKTNIYRDMTDEQLSAALFGTGGSQGSGGAGNSERIVGQTADGRNIYNSVGGGYYTYDPRTGQARALTKAEYNNANMTNQFGEEMVNPMQFIYNDPEVQALYSDQQLNELANSLPKSMPINEARTVLSMVKQNYDISKILSSRALAGKIQPEQTYTDWSSGEQVTPEPKPETTPGNQTRETSFTEADQMIRSMMEEYNLDTEGLRQLIVNNKQSLENDYPTINFDTILSLLNK